MEIQQKMKRMRFLYRILLWILFMITIYYIYNGDIHTSRLKAVVTAAALYLFAYILLTFYLRVKEKNLYLYSTILDVDEMSGIEFEIFLKYHFKNMGYQVRLTPVTGDYGADLVIKKRRETAVVQAKRYNSKVGIKAVQEAAGAIKYYNADRAYVITNHYFTANAVSLADSNDIELWDRDKIIEFMTEDIVDEQIHRINQNKLKSIEYETCHECGGRLVVREGKYGKFIGCSNFPECHYTKQYQPEL